MTTYLCAIEAEMLENDSEAEGIVCDPSQWVSKSICEVEADNRAGKV